MPINDLLRHHQLARINAAEAEASEDRETYFDLVGYYAGRIRQWREDEGLPNEGWPGTEARPSWTRN